MAAVAHGELLLEQHLSAGREALDAPAATLAPPQGTWVAKGEYTSAYLIASSPIRGYLTSSDKGPLLGDPILDSAFGIVQ